MAGSESDGRDMEINFGFWTALAVAAAIVGSALLAWGALSSSRSEKKMMKAPGRDHRIPREEFEKNPRKHFRDLRGKTTD